VSPLRGVTWGALAIAAVALIFAAYDGYRWWQAENLNAALADGSLAQYRGVLPPRAMFAKATLLARREDLDGALEHYKRTESSNDAVWAGAARYNAANLHLRRALAMRAAGDEAHALPLLELAKEGYRAVLRAEPQYWDAKYNLERALRLAPEADDEEDSAMPAPSPKERAPTTMRGFTLGLP